MVKSIVIQRTGGPEVLEITDIKLPDLKDGEVRIRHSVIGLNFFDIESRRGGGSPNMALPAILGHEACGYVEETKGNVGALKVGDRVAYATAPGGAYCEARNIDHKFLVGVPKEISDEQAAAVLFKGLAAHYLTRRIYHVKKGMVALVHSAAGGTGMMLTRFCKDLGAEVIGTVGSDEKIRIAKSNGCDLVINYSKEDFAEKVMSFTNNRGADIVYDSVGKKTFESSLRSLREFSLMVSYGFSSGDIGPFRSEILTKKNHFFTRPNIFKYKQNRMELSLSASEVFEMLKKGIIKDNINSKYKFSDISKAHQAIENRSTAGSNIIIV